ncbi:MAG: anti-sigma factor, partial [Candidatus Limnocylindrales bacterium]
DVLERLELAAVEPGGLERLMAGDAADAAAAVAHLAGCDACADELQRLTRAAPLLRDVIRTTPPTDLRARTLEHVRTYGRRRGAPAADIAAPFPSPATPAMERPNRMRALLPWVATLAAAVVLSVGISAAVGRGAEDRLAAQARAIEGLGAVTTATLAITAQPDVQRVSLAPADGDPATGTLIFSPSTTRLVVVADGLEQPVGGHEYRCWMEIGGQRSPVGRMFFAGDLAFWVGDTPAVSEAAAGTRFGVSLVALDGGSLGTEPVIVGDL